MPELFSSDFSPPVRPCPVSLHNTTSVGPSATASCLAIEAFLSEFRSPFRSLSAEYGETTRQAVGAAGGTKAGFQYPAGGGIGWPNSRRKCLNVRRSLGGCERASHHRDDAANGRGESQQSRKCGREDFKWGWRVSTTLKTCQRDSISGCASFIPNLLRASHVQCTHAWLAARLKVEG